MLHASMPLEGDNEADRTGRAEERPHDWLGSLETADYSPMRLMLTPQIEALNWASDNRSYEKIIAAGRSGGGWAVGMLAALDDRITDSFVFSGGLPSLVKGSRQPDIGDWEQQASKVYDIVDYGDLYLLASAGLSRQANFYWNQFDTCCFAGARALTFFPQLQALGTDWGLGGLDYYVDTNRDRGHSITPRGIGDMALSITETSALPDATMANRTPQ